MLAASRVRWLEFALGAVALTSLTLSLRVNRHLLAAALAALAGQILALDLIHAQPAIVLVILAAALLLLGELASLFFSLRALQLVEPAVLRRRGTYLAIVAVGSGVVAAIAEAASRVVISGGLAAAAGGVLATVIVVALIGGLARRAAA